MRVNQAIQRAAVATRRSAAVFIFSLGAGEVLHAERERAGE